MPSHASSRLTRLRFLKDWRFWLNYAAVLLVTCWLPMLSQVKRLTTPEGTVVHEETLSVRAYQSWLILLSEGPGVGHGQAVLTHLFLSLAVVVVVWFLMMRPEKNKACCDGGNPPESSVQ